MPRESKGSKWKDITIEAFTGGINKSIRPELIPQEDFTVCDNVVLKQRRVVIDTGYKTFADEVRGIPQTDYQYYKRTGTSELLLITTETVYKYSSAQNEWQYVAMQTPTTSNLISNAGALTIKLVSTSGFVNDAYMGITLDDGSQHRTRVNGAPVAGVVTFDDAIPVGRNAPNGTSVVLAVDLAGDLDFQISAVAVPSNDWIAFTNGIDPPKYYDGTICADIPGLPAGVTACRVLQVYNAALFMFATTEGGLDYPQRVRRSDIGDPTNWTTNTAGFDDLYVGADFIVAAETLGPYLIVYRERSIIRGQYVNTGGTTYAFDTTVDGEGASSSQSVVNLNSQHLVFCNAGIYSFTGGYDLDSIGDKIFYQVFSDSGDLNTVQRGRIFSFYVEELDEAWFFYPSGESEFPNVLLRYNVGDENWSRRVFADPIVGFGFYQSITSHRWVDLIGAWSAQTFRWNSRSVSTDSPTTHLMSADQNIVFEYDYITLTDNGEQITAVVETQDLFNKDFSMRHDTIQFYGKGTDVEVEYSTDAGNSYTTLGTVSSSNLEIHTLSSQFICDKIRYRFTSSNPNFELDWLYVSYLEEAYPMYRSNT